MYDQSKFDKNNFLKQKNIIKEFAHIKCDNKGHLISKQSTNRFVNKYQLILIFLIIFCQC